MDERTNGLDTHIVTMRGHINLYEGTEHLKQLKTEVTSDDGMRKM